MGKAQRSPKVRDMQRKIPYLTHTSRAARSEAAMSDEPNGRPILDTHELPIDGGHKPVPMTPVQRETQPAPSNDKKNK
jgi:hypothetical protein